MSTTAFPSGSFWPEDCSLQRLLLPRLVKWVPLVQIYTINLSPSLSVCNDLSSLSCRMQRHHLSVQLCITSTLSFWDAVVFLTESSVHPIPASCLSVCLSLLHSLTDPVGSVSWSHVGCSNSRSPILVIIDKSSGPEPAPFRMLCGLE